MGARLLLPAWYGRVALRRQLLWRLLEQLLERLLERLAGGKLLAVARALLLEQGRLP